MHSSLQPQWHRLEKIRQEYQQYVEHANPAQLAFKPAPDAWSIQQVLRHVINVDQLSTLSLVRQKDSKKSKKKSIGTILRSALLRIMLKSPLKFKAPPIPELQPEEEQNILALLQEWETSRLQLQQFLDALPDAKLDYEIYRHPRSGWLTVLQALQFLEDHLRHHQQQLERIRKASAFPV